MADTMTVNGYLPFRYNAGKGAWELDMDAILAHFVFLDPDGEKRLDEVIAELQAAANKVYPETSTSQTARTVTIPGVTSWDDLLNIPINIKAAAYGTDGETSLDVNGESGLLGAKSLYFPNLTASGLTVDPAYYWTRTGGVYTVVWDGTYLTVLNMQVREASTSYPGIVKLSSSTSSESTTLAATSSAVKAAYDLADAASAEAEAASAATDSKAPLESPEFTGTPTVPSKTSAATNDGTLVATEAQVALKANLASPAFTGTPTAPNGTDYSTSRVRNIYMGTADLIAGSSPLPSGSIYIMYE